MRKEIKKEIASLRRRINLLDKYRDMDIDKEILSCYNQINRLKERLK